MLKRLLSVTLAGSCLSFVACVAPSDNQDGISHEEALTSDPIAGLVEKPLVSPDGQNMFLNFAPGPTSASGTLAVRAVAGGPVRVVKEYGPDTKVSVSATNGGFVAVLSKGEGYQVVASKWNDPAATTTIAASSIAGAAAAKPKAIHLTEDGNWVLGISGEYGVLFVSRVATGAIPAVFPLASGAKTHAIRSKGDQVVIVTARNENVGLVRGVSLAGGTPSLGTAYDLPVKVDSLLSGFHNVYLDKFDGTHLVVEGNEPGEPTHIDRIDIHTGAVEQLATLGRLSFPTFDGGAVWYPSEERVFDDLANDWYKKVTLFRLGLGADDEAQPIATGRGYGPRVVVATPDGQGVVYKSDATSSTYRLLFQRLDGVSPAKEILPPGKYGSSSSRAVGKAYMQGSRLIVESQDESATERSYTVHDTTGALLASFKIQPQSGYTFGTFSGDGTVFYMAGFDPEQPLQCSALPGIRICDTLGHLSWPSATSVVPVPGSPNVLSYRQGRMVTISP